MKRNKKHNLFMKEKRRKSGRKGMRMVGKERKWRKEEEDLEIAFK